MQFQKVNKFSEKTVNIRAGGTILALASLLFVSFALPVYATLDDDFDSYSPGSLETVTSGEWFCLKTNVSCSEWSIASDYSNSSPNSLKLIENGDPPEVITSLYASLDNFQHTFWFRRSVQNSYDIELCYYDTSGGSGNEICDGLMGMDLLDSGDGDFRVSSQGGGSASLTDHEIDPHTWYRVTLDFDVSEKKVRGRFMYVDGTYTPWTDWTPSGTWTDFPDHIRLYSDSYSGTHNFWIDDWGMVSGSATSSSSGGHDGETRLIRHDPSMGQTLASTTQGYMQNATYFVADGVNTSLGTRIDKNDYCNGISILRVCTTKIQLNVKRADSTYVNVYAENVPSGGENYIQHWKSTINSPGTYWYEVRIYNAYVGSRWLPELNEEILYQTGKFYVGSPTSQEDLDAFWSVNDIEARNEIIDASSVDPGTISSPSVVALMFDNVVDQFLHLPPWGYAVVFNETLKNGTSTQLGTLTMSFPTTSVAHGTTLDLPITSGFTNAITIINANGVIGEYGNQFDTFLHYWELLWYIIFAIWVGKEVLGVWGGTDLDDTHTLDLSNSKVSGGRRHDNQRGTLDLRKKK